MAEEPEKGQGRGRRRPIWGAMALGAVAAALAIALVPHVRHDVGPATLSAGGSFGFGITDLAIPPLGSVEADTPKGSLSIDLALEEVDIPRLAAALDDDPSGETLTDEIAGDLQGLVTALALRLLLGAALLGALAVAILPRRDWQHVVAGAGGGAIGMAVIILVAAVTFSVDAFSEPRFTGALTRAPLVIDALNRGDLDVSQVQDRFEVAAERLTDLLALLDEPNLDPRKDSVAILHISDMHSNPIGLEIAVQLARQFDVDAVLDTGDLTNFGVGLETRFATLVERFHVPYVYVPGNHDSTSVRAALRSLDNVTLLDGSSTEILGIEIQGFSDPTYTNWDSLSPAEAADIKLEEAALVAERVAQVEPDILAVHDNRLATESYGLVPLILSGHYHRQITSDENGTLSLVVGSTGAAGLKSFTVESDMNYEAEIIYLKDARPVAYDYVTFTGLGSDFIIKRSMLDDLGPLVPPSPSPSPTESPTG